MQRIEQHIFLALAALALALSVLCYWFVEQNAPGATDEQYLSAVQQRVKEEMQTSTAELQRVVEQIRQHPNATFEQLNLPTTYPYFIFRSHPKTAHTPSASPELVFWSDYRFIPDYVRLANVRLPQLIQFEQGQYVVSRAGVRSGADSLEVFSLVNVFRQYRNHNTYLQSGYNPGLFSLDPRAVTATRTNVYQAIYDNNSVFLFSVVPPEVNAYRNQSTPVNTVILATIGTIFLGLYVFQTIRRLRRKRRYGMGFVWLATYLVLLRGVMLYFGVPFLFVESDLFNPKFYASSVLVPSLGDLLLNVVVVLLLAFYGVSYYYRSQCYTHLLRLASPARRLVSVGCVVLSYWLFWYCYVELNNIYEKSQFTLDITLSIRFSVLKIVCLLIFVAISTIYFLINHLLASFFVRFNKLRVSGVLWIVLGTALAALLFYVAGVPLEPILLLNGLYFLLIYAGRLPRVLYSFRYKTSIYLFLAAFVCAATTAYVAYTQEIRKQLTQEQAFGKQLLAENDEFGEFLLSKAREFIAADTDIANALRNDTLLVRERIQQRVKSVHLDKYFDKYDIDISSFRANGRPLDISSNAASLTTLQTRYRQPRYQTEYPDIYFINEVGNQFIKQYVCFVPIRRLGGGPDVAGSTAAQTPLGYVVLDLRLRSERPKSVYPELLVDTRFIQNPEAQEYSYAIYGGKPVPRLLYSAGNYNYERKLPVSYLKSPDLYTKGLIISGSQHVGQLGKDGRIVVVSSDEYPFSNIFSNFSFLYLLLVLTVIVVIGIYAIMYGLARFSINYSTRIQLLLNVAFFLPLVMVIIIILSVISSNYIANQESTYINNTENIAANFLTYLDEYLQGKRSKASMEEELRKIARDSDTDINLFDTKGRLSVSTRPLMYESGHLSKRINPEAYIHLIENKENQVLLNESLGSKQYRTAYAGIKAYNGRLLGVLSIPYFYARAELDRQLIEVIASALSVFTVLFLLFLALSYFASTVLTKPLKLLTQKIRKTNLDQLNEPLPWRSDDEIGILIREYNRMLVKLDENKQALAQTEKQSAWREMAKQVAHEIKNPLTPMKLTLQQLQRTLPNTDNPTDAGEARPGRNLKRTFDLLLDQIDNLSDIATSFSDFAEMPLPKNEVFEVTNVLNKAADLYADDKRISLRRQIAPGPIMAIGDRQLIGRMLTNLIINGIQSVPPGRKPVLDLRLHATDDNVQIEVHDNGAGIPEAIRKKVFLPNFSTKRGGSGLGLAIAKRGVEHAGGTIWFETTEGVGTSFFVLLRIATETMPPGRSQPGK